MNCFSNQNQLNADALVVNQSPEDMLSPVTVTEPASQPASPRKTRCLLTWIVPVKRSHKRKAPSSAASHPFLNLALVRLSHDVMDGLELLERIPFERVQEVCCRDMVIQARNLHGVSVHATDLEAEVAFYEAYLAHYDRTLGGVVVRHRLAKHKWGRGTADNALWVSRMRRVLKNTLLQGLYIDIDMVNAHPAILFFFVFANDIPCPFLERYVLDRDSCLKEVCDEYSCSKADAKNLFLSLLYGGLFPHWGAELGIHEAPLPLIAGFQGDLFRIATELKKYNPALLQVATTKCAQSSNANIDGTFLSLFCQEIEKRVMTSVFTEMRIRTGLLTVPNSPHAVCTYEFDGFKLLRENVDKFGGVSAVEEFCTRACLQKTGLAIQFKEKKMEDCLPLPKTQDVSTMCPIDCQPVTSDVQAAERVLDLYPYWKKTQSGLHAFDDRTGLWTKDPHQHVAIIRRFEPHLNLVKPNAKGHLIKKGNYATDHAMRGIIPANLADLPQIHDHGWETASDGTSVRCLLFPNGYLDATGPPQSEVLFHSLPDARFDPNRVFHSRFDWDYSPEESEELNKAKTKVYQTLFLDTLDAERGPYLLQHLARALFADNNKTILIGVGDGDSGKSCLINAIQRALGPLGQTIDTDVLLESKGQSGGDTASRMRWAFLNRHARICVGSELKADRVLDGKLLKNIAGGGDPLVGRTHYGEETQFEPDFMLFIVGNDIPRINPTDQPLLNRVRIFEFDHLFVPKVDPKQTNQRLKDPLLPERLKTFEFRKALIYLLVDAYNAYRVHGELPCPPRCAKSAEDWLGNLEDVGLTGLLEMYELTHNAADRVPVKEIKEIPKDVTMAKFAIMVDKKRKAEGIDIDKLPLKTHTTRLGKTSHQWQGIRRKTPEELHG